MRNQTNKAEALLSLIRRGEHMTFKQQLELTIRFEYSGSCSSDFIYCYAIY